MVYIHELVVRARRQDSVAQLVRPLHRNRRTAGSIPASGPIVTFLRPIVTFLRPIVTFLRPIVATAPG